MWGRIEPAGADGESDQSIAQISNLKCQNDCNQLMSTEWPTGNEMGIDKELNLSCNCNTVLTEVVEDQEAKDMNLSRMCE